MVEVNQIPHEVKRAMRSAWARRNNSDAPERHMADLAVAMLAAWPGAETPHPCTQLENRQIIILPLTEVRDDAL